MTTEPKSKLNNTRYLILLIQFFKIITSHAKVQIWPRCYTNWNKKKKTTTTTVASTILEQYFAQISSSQEIWFCLARKRLQIHQKTSDYLTESYLIFTDGLLDLQLLEKIEFYVVQVVVLILTGTYQ